MTHELWASLNKTLEDVLRRATLARLAAEYEARKSAPGVAYVKIDPEAMRRGRKNLSGPKAG